MLVDQKYIKDLRSDAVNGMNVIDGRDTIRVSSIAVDISLAFLSVLVDIRDELKDIREEFVEDDGS